MSRILIVDDDRGTLEWMEAALTGAGHEVQVAPSAQRALALLDLWTPDLALIDVLMPEIDGWAFNRMILHYGIPVLFVSIVHVEGEAVLRGCTGFLRKPLSPARLRAEVQRILGSPRERPTILVVDDDPDIRFALASILELSFDVIDAEHGAQALELLERHRVSLVITDVRMPVMDGRELVRRIRGDPRWARLPILVQTGDREAARLPIWSELQVEQVMTKDSFVDWLLERIDQRAPAPRLGGPVGERL
jgi:CheY-like chemotaxis protein